MALHTCRVLPGHGPGPINVISLEEWPHLRTGGHFGVTPDRPEHGCCQRRKYLHEIQAQEESLDPSKPLWTSFLYHFQAFIYNLFNFCHVHSIPAGTGNVVAPVCLWGGFFCYFQNIPQRQQKAKFQEWKRKPSLFRLRDLLNIPTVLPGHWEME